MTCLTQSYSKAGQYTSQSGAPGIAGEGYIDLPDSPLPDRGNAMMGRLIDLRISIGILCQQHIAQFLKHAVSSRC